MLLCHPALFIVVSFVSLESLQARLMCLLLCCSRSVPVWLAAIMSVMEAGSLHACRLTKYPTSLAHRQLVRLTKPGPLVCTHASCKLGRLIGGPLGIKGKRWKWNILQLIHVAQGAVARLIFAQEGLSCCCSVDHHDWRYPCFEQGRVINMHLGMSIVLKPGRRGARCHLPSHCLWIWLLLLCW